MKRNKDTLKQILKDVKSSNESRVSGLEAKLAKARAAICMVLSMVHPDQIEFCGVAEVDLDEDQVQQLRDAI